MSLYPVEKTHAGASITTEKISNKNYKVTISGIDGRDSPIVLENLRNGHDGIELAKKMIDEHLEKHWCYLIGFQLTKKLEYDNTWSYCIYKNGTKIGGMEKILSSCDLILFANREVKELSKIKELQESLPIDSKYKNIFFTIDMCANNKYSLSFEKNFSKNHGSYSSTLMRHHSEFELPKIKNSPATLLPLMLPNHPIKKLESVNTAINLAKKIINFCMCEFTFVNNGREISISKTVSGFNYLIKEGKTSFGFTGSSIGDAIDKALGFESNPRNK